MSVQWDGLSEEPRYVVQVQTIPKSIWRDWLDGIEPGPRVFASVSEAEEFIKSVVNLAVGVVDTRIVKLWEVEQVLSKTAKENGAV